MRHVILDTDEDVRSFFSFMDAEIPSGSIIAFDLETDSASEVKANIYGIGLAFHDEEGYYIPIRKPNGDLFFGANTLDYISELSNRFKDYRLLGHNIIYDVLVWRHSTGVDLTPYVHADTILMKHTVDEEPPFGLKELAVREFGEEADLAQKELYENIKQNGGSTTKECMEMFKADTHVLGKYCAHDVMLTYKLFELYSRRIEQEGLLSFFYEEEVMPLYREVTIPMKYHGIHMDVEFLKELSKEISKDIKVLEEKVYTSIKPLIEDYERDFLNENYPPKPTGNFPKVYAELIGIGELKSVAKKVIASLDAATEDQKEFKQWMLGEIAELSDKAKIRETQILIHKRKTGKDTVFNLSSKAQLKWLFFEKLGLDPLSKTETGEPQVDDKFLDSVAKDYEWVGYLQDMNKLEKLRSTYIDGMMEYIIDGKVYTSMLQFGTTSGRYASRGPNCQNAPRPKEEDSGLSEVVLKYNNSIRKAFISAPNWVFVDADYSALEPRCFAHMSGDKNLQNIFHSGEDMYSSIAKRVFNLDNVSTFKSDSNFLGKLYPEKRQIIKALALAVTYGAEAFRIADLLNISKEEAQKLIDDYLKAYPGLKNYISDSHYQAVTKGYVKTIFGRIRHLPTVKELYDKYGYNLLDLKWAKQRGLTEERRTLKNGLNNSTNFRIQGLAAHIVNRAMLNIMRTLRKNNLNGYVCLQVHDQIVVHCPEEEAEMTREIVKYCMENVAQLSVPLVAEPKIAKNLKDSH